jgi:hypothetical protein
MKGLIVFSTLAEALHAGYTVYDRTATGYLVRTQTARGYALAIVDLRHGAPKRVATF